MIVSTLPPRPARPENGTTAIDAPRRSSSSQTADCAGSSPRPGPSRAACGRAASRPEGVRHGSPDSALQMGHRRARQPRAQWSGEKPCRLCPNRLWRQRAAGAARHSGHQSASQVARSLTRHSGDAPPRPTSGARGELGRPSAGDHFWQENAVSCQKSEKVPANASHSRESWECCRAVKLLQISSFMRVIPWIAPRRSPVRVRLAPSRKGLALRGFSAGWTCWASYLGASSWCLWTTCVDHRELQLLRARRFRARQSST